MISRIKNIEETSQKVVHQIFHMMLNPKFRGENFDFQTFDIASHVESTLSVCFSKPLNTEEKERVRCLAKQQWKELLESTGVLNWIKSQK